MRTLKRSECGGGLDGQVVPTEHGELAIMPAKGHSSGLEQGSPAQSEQSFSTEGGLQETWCGHPDFPRGSSQDTARWRVCVFSMSVCLSVKTPRGPSVQI